MPDTEAYRVLNMGVGMALVVAAEEVDRVLEAAPESDVIGSITDRPGITLV